MPLVSGTLLGPYQILAPLGAGGMGEVYRAKDGRLGREVAIKVLPAGFAIDGERLKRFELEAKATSALNHPNILSIFDIGTHEGAPYLVAELLEGETLREKLTGPVPPRKAVEWAVQMAHGLAAAHEKNIVHRDLKPENLFITKDGRLKILDFGLAKLTEAAKPPEEENNTPTRTVNTAAGSVMGTIGYMSPEQVRGEPVDARSDLFAFGVILYEMISGARAFKKNSAVETMNAILTEEPQEFASLQPPPPPGLERIIGHCLEKTPAARYQSARDLGFQLEALSGVSGVVSSISTAPVPAAPARQVIRAELLPPEKTKYELDGKNSHSLVISPDGRMLVFVAETADNKKPLWVRSLDKLRASSLAGTENAISPFWSPDSRQIGYFCDGMLKKIELSGGTITTLCNASGDEVVGTWSTENTILFASNRGIIHQVAAKGGKALPIAWPSGLDPEITPHWPVFLPDGRHYLYRRRADQSRRPVWLIYAASLDGKTNEFVLQVDSRTFALGSGHLFFMRGQELFTQKFDAGKLSVVGEARCVAESVQRILSKAHGIYSVSQNGVLVYQSGVGNDYSKVKLVWLDRMGKRAGVLGKPAVYRQFRISPDGRQVAAIIEEPDKGTTDLWICDVARGLKTRLTVDSRIKLSPIWSPDSRRIVFSTVGDERNELHEINVDGSGTSTLLLESKKLLVPIDWHPDGKLIAYVESELGEKKRLWSLWGMSMEGDRTPIPLLPAGMVMPSARFSPDGKWLAFCSNQSGQEDIFITPFPGPGGKTLVATDGSDWPVWRRDGKALFFWTKGMLFEVEINASEFTIEVGEPKRIFSLQSVGAMEDDKDIDVNADGTRFLMSTTSEDEAKPPSVTLVVNWDVEK